MMIKSDADRTVWRLKNITFSTLMPFTMVLSPEFYIERKISSVSKSQSNDSISLKGLRVFHRICVVSILFATLSPDNRLYHHFNSS